MKLATITRVIISLILMIIIWKNVHWSVALFLTYQWLGNEVLGVWINRVNRLLGMDEDAR